MVRLEVITCVRDELLIARMIDRLDAGDVCNQPWLVGVHVLHQLGLGIRRSGDQDGLAIGERRRNMLIEVLILGGMTRANRTGLVVDVARRVLGPDHDAF